MQKPKTQNLLSFSNALIATTIITFWVMYLVISFYNRPASDDYSFVALCNTYGIWGGATRFYMTWDGNIFNTLFLTLSAFLIQDLETLVAFNLFLLVILSVTTFFLINELSKYSKFSFSFLSAFFVSQLFVQVIFYSGFSITENWFWVTGSITYMFPLCIIFTLTGCLFRFNRTKSIAYLITSLLLVFVFASTRLNYVFVWAVFSFLLFCIHYYKTRKIPGYIVLYFTVLIIGSLMNLLAPGNYKRMLANKTMNLHINHPSLMYQLLHTPMEISQKIICTKGIFIMAFTLPIAYLISVMVQNNNIIPSGKKLLVATTAFFFLFVFSLLSNTAILYFAYAGWGRSDRTMLHISMFFVAFCISGILLFFSRFLKKQSFIFYLPLCICIYLNVKTLVNQYPIVSKYAQSHDVRTKFILEAKQTFKGNLLLLDSLPPSGILFSAEMGKDTNNYINVDMKSRFDLPFAIALK